MSRRRYISTEISTDKHVKRLSDSAALFYTWMIPHVEEDATLTSDPEELQAIVVPNRPGWTLAKVVKCLREIEAQGLVVAVNGTLYLPPDSFYRYQSNIHLEKRRTEQPGENPCIEVQTAENSGEQRETARNSASPSPSPSPSPSKHMSNQRSDVDVVFEYWQKVMTRPQSSLSPKRRVKIERALKVIGVKGCCTAVDGCAATPHNMGHNQNGTKYNDIELILRDPEHWERFMEQARKAYRPPPPKPPEPEMTPEEQAKAREGMQKFKEMVAGFGGMR